MDSLKNENKVVNKNRVCVYIHVDFIQNPVPYQMHTKQYKSSRSVI